MKKKVLWEYLDLRDVTTGSPLPPLVKENRLIEVKDSKMEKLTEIGASNLFTSQNIKEQRLGIRDGQGMQHTRCSEKQNLFLNPKGRDHKPERNDCI
jgi:hypothetical protein